MRVFIAPDFTRPDEGDGGIRRVVEAQRKYLPEYGIDVVTDIGSADLVAIHAGTWRDTDAPVIAHCHGLYWSEYEWPLWAKRLNSDVVKVLHRAAAVTAPSEWVANALRRGMWNDVTVLPHGISTDEWKPLPVKQRENYVLWNKSRVDPVCDPTPLGALADLMPQQKFVSTYDLGEHDNVTVTNTLSYVAAKQLVERAGIYLCTSRETFGIGTIEALAAGVPVVGWSWGGQVDIVKHKETGWLCSPGDVDGLAEGVEWCTKHLAEISKAARSDVLKRYTWGNAIKAYVPVYENALNRASMSSVRVSVIVPCYKLERYLEQCLASISRQGLDCEVIVVNDASPDWSADTERMVLATGAKVINNGRNEYLAGALNVGVAASSGRYIVCLDADNFLADNSLAILAGELDKHPMLDIAYGACKFIRESGEPDTSISPDGISTWPFSDFSYRAQMTHHNQIPSTSMYRRWVWERSGGYRRRCRTGEDADFWCRATSIGAIPAKVTDAVTLVYRNRDDSMSRVNKDWPWEAWYPWSYEPSLTPFAAPRDDAEYPTVQSCDPQVVTVVIPVGPGHEEIVVDAVDSIIAQTYQKWRIVVVNDSGLALARLPSFVTVLSTNGGTGPAHARNVGIADVKSPYTVLLDADDILEPTALQDFISAARDWPGYVYSDWIVHETGALHECDEWSVAALEQTMFHAVTCLYPTKALKAVKGFDEQLDSWEDYDLLLKLCTEGVCGTRVAKPLLRYRVTMGTVRESLYARKSVALENLREKWSGKLACGSCAQRAQQPNPVLNDPVPSFNTVQHQADTSDLVQMLFVMPEKGARSYLGPVSGAEYRFSADEPVQYVFKQDVDELLRRPEFRLYTGQESVVTANA
jgi:glycosyltransferase involved in cell wall biosynthesis